MRVPSWAKAGALLALTLAAGIAIGVSYERRRVSVHETGAADHMVGHLSQVLELDSAQQRAVAAILARHQHVVDSTWHTVQPHVRATMDSTLREIRAVLRPEQVGKYESVIGAMHGQVRH